METKTYYFMQLVTGMIIVSDEQILFKEGGWILNEKDGYVHSFWDVNTKSLLVNFSTERRYIVASWQQTMYKSYWENTYESNLKS